MGGGASKEEKMEGVAVTGMYWKKVEMPAGVVAHQLPSGRKKQERFLGETPTKLRALNEAKGTTELYDALKSSMVEDDGLKWFGWHSKGLNEVVTRFQPAFNEKGIGLHFNRVKWYVSHGQHGGHMEYRFWLEFADSAVAQPAVGYVPVFAYNAAQDAEFESGNEPTPIVLAVAAEDVIEMSGSWEVDMESLPEDAVQNIEGGQFLISRTGDVYHIKSSMQLKTWFWRHEANTDTPMQPKGHNVYDIRHKGKTTSITFHSATSATIVYKEKIAVPLVKAPDGSTPNTHIEDKLTASAKSASVEEEKIAG